MITFGGFFLLYVFGLLYSLFCPNIYIELTLDYYPKYDSERGSLLTAKRLFVG